LNATSLRVEIYPERQKAEFRGAYRLVNDSAVAIESAARRDRKMILRLAGFPALFAHNRASR
jgi:hypothetical protein